MMDSHIPLCCESRSYLSPVTDALHLFYGSAGCSVCPGESRRKAALPIAAHSPALSAHLKNPKGLTHGKRKLYRGLINLIDGHGPAAAFVYTAGKAESMGDEIDAVCFKVEKETKIPVIPVHSEGFRGERKAGDRAACEALFRLMGTGNTRGISPVSVNILGGFHNEEAARSVAAHCRTLGIEVVGIIPGSPVADIRRCHGAALNILLAEGAMLQLALMMEVEYGIPIMHLDCEEGRMTASAVSAVTHYFCNHA